MSEYAEFIGGDNIDLDTVQVYNFFTHYFNNPLLKKIKTIAGGNVMYCCKIKSFLSKDKKYIFIITNTLINCKCYKYKSDF